ncbi:hypothetical protein PPERSA_04112 [Pseudocohnilembus persalinus]|uniref:SMP-LTD domain-containing protein n=1 Tax=Pseudocohnilembus persalinus TaxID=266149 RepID=A0A0V0QNC4_PSEPJ|nr:hypothetical protein PPERSA_04112 [Pseudocohnilembus persalinus]|eukprot:KRX03560.1 hypothetical protein PPERSA_04112 [Pseudocohnilembus persalinus]
MKQVLIQTDKGLSESVNQSINSLEVSIIDENYVGSDDDYDNNSLTYSQTLNQSKIKILNVQKLKQNFQQKTVGHAQYNTKDYLIDIDNELHEINPQKSDDYYIKLMQHLLNAFFGEWKQNDYFKSKIKKTLWRSLNKNLPDFLEEMSVEKLNLIGEPPLLKGVRGLKSEPYEFLADIDLEFTGSVYLEVETALHVNWPRKDFKILPVKIKIEIKQFIATLRLCFVPRIKGKSWQKNQIQQFVLKKKQYQLKKVFFRRRTSFIYRHRPHGWW